ncbi:hypothetical protein [Streptomyces chiangmaiensis]|uniref:Uncharacterized protein n=1 Tax=Streptomyces chiangmaiensis TaxID=766497 RepID=A0ABU7FGB7_9ACTN|nr:hypothetical protein [Streptomyces chiangmaiensis]MED7823108.1 hypothetical protein [Streptomyces chiangmaiensis]
MGTSRALAGCAALVALATMAALLSPRVRTLDAGAEPASGTADEAAPVPTVTGHQAHEEALD